MQNNNQYTPMRSSSLLFDGFDCFMKRIAFLLTRSFDRWYVITKPHVVGKKRLPVGKRFVQFCVFVFVSS